MKSPPHFRGEKGRRKLPSAWYVFSALGFYPVCPGSGQYALGTPLFRKAVLHLPGGDVLIDAPDNSDEAFYVQSLTLNGKAWNHNYLEHSDLVGGAKLRFGMSAQPSYTRGTDPADKPYSMASAGDLQSANNQ